MKEPERSTTEPTRNWLLMKRNLYFRPDAQGYTGIRDHAGLYTEEEASDRVRDGSSGVSMIRLDEAPEFTSACYDDLARDHLTEQRDEARAALAAERAEAERLRAEHAELESIFDIRHRADVRAIERWRDAAPGRDLKAPDHADMVVWLLSELDAEREQANSAKGEAVGLALEIARLTAERDRWHATAIGLEGERDEAAARAAVLRDALNQAAGWFDDYAAGHHAKGAADKAERNERRAKACRDACILAEDDTDARKAGVAVIEVP